MNPKAPELIESAEELVAFSRKLITNPEKRRVGGILTAALNGFSIVYSLPIGDFPPEKLDKYGRLSQEKAHRLYAHWLRQPGEAVSSWQTRSPKAEDLMPGGAVLFYCGARPDIISFSGLHEKVDEAVSTLLGYRHRMVVVSSFVERVAGVSDNEVLREMFDRYWVDGERP